MGAQYQKLTDSWLYCEWPSVSGRLVGRSSRSAGSFASSADTALASSGASIAFPVLASSVIATTGQ